MSWGSDEWVRGTAQASVIPVLVAGIQRPRGGWAFVTLRGSPAFKDLGALDSRDKHRNDGGRVRRPNHSSSLRSSD